jgi:hypothetical protein
VDLFLTLAALLWGGLLFGPAALEVLRGRKKE